MKGFKQLRNEINELAEDYSEGGGMGYDPTLSSKGRSAVDMVQPTNYNNVEDLDKLNAFLSAFTSRTYLDPKSALFLLRAKMNHVNVDVDLTRATDLEIGKQYELPLMRFGGTFGSSPTHALAQAFEKTNGFNGVNFVLQLTVEPSGGEERRAPYFIKARIVEK